MAQTVYEFAGAGWYGEVFREHDRSWSWVAALDLVDRVKCGGSRGFYTSGAAERSMRAFIRVEQETDIDRWVAFAARLSASEPIK